MLKGRLTLSYKEIDRLSVIQRITDKRISQTKAAERLQLSVRQIKRLIKNYKTHGAIGLVSKHRERRSNNAISDDVRSQALKLIKQEYYDFSPTLAHEKLTEIHGMSFSRETLRHWMIGGAIWQPKARKKARIHQRRPRRSCRGELIQIDGSPHDWFEGRAANCTLIVFIDDATSELMALKFSPTETTQSYMETLEEHLQQHGRPIAIYSDKHSIFRINHKNCERDVTQFSRALKTLDIEPIHANTPQAKGRVERANQTLQDRLVKEMRLHKINSIEEANAFLPLFMADYNRRFSVKPRDSKDAHRRVLHNQDELALILSTHHQRKLSKNLALQFCNREYQLQGYSCGYQMRGAAVTVCESFDGSISLLYKGKQLRYRLLYEGEAPVPIADEKSIHRFVDDAKEKQKRRSAWKPAVDHPWRNYPIGRTAVRN